MTRTTRWLNTWLVQANELEQSYVHATTDGTAGRLSRQFVFVSIGRLQPQGCGTCVVSFASVNWRRFSTIRCRS